MGIWIEKAGSENFLSPPTPSRKLCLSKSLTAKREIPQGPPPPSPGNTLGLFLGLDSFDVQLEKWKTAVGLPETQQKEKSRIANVKLPPSDKDYADGTESQKQRQKWPDAGISKKWNARGQVRIPAPYPIIILEIIIPTSKSCHEDWK